MWKGEVRNEGLGRQQWRKHTGWDGYRSGRGAGVGPGRSWLSEIEDVCFGKQCKQLFKNEMLACVVPSFFWQPWIIMKMWDSEMLGRKFRVANREKARIIAHSLRVFSMLGHSFNRSPFNVIFYIQSLPLFIAYPSDLKRTTVFKAILLKSRQSYWNIRTLETSMSYHTIEGYS